MKSIQKIVQLSTTRRRSLAECNDDFVSHKQEDNPKEIQSKVCEMKTEFECTVSKVEKHE